MKTTDSRVAAVVRREGDPATVAWAHEGVGELASLADPELAIAAAAALGNTRALQSVTTPKALKKAAAAELHKLRAAGVKVAPPAPVDAKLGKEEELPRRAFFGVSEGAFLVILTFPADDGVGLYSVAYRPGAGPSARFDVTTRARMHDAWRIGREPGVHEVPFAVGLHYAQRFRGSAWHDMLALHPGFLAETAADPLATLPPAEAEGEAPSTAWIGARPTLTDAERSALVTQLLEAASRVANEGVEASTIRSSTDSLVRALAMVSLERDRALQADTARLFAELADLAGRRRRAAALREEGDAILAGKEGAGLRAVEMAVRLAAADALRATAGVPDEHTDEPDDER